MLSLSVHDVVKEYKDSGNRAVDGVSFEINPGEATILLGSNGSGKTTLLKSINGLVEATSGSIYVGDIDVAQARRQNAKSKLKKVRRQIGMVFQQFHLIDNLSVLQNVLFGAWGRTHKPWKLFSPFANDRDRYKAMECLDRVGLSDFAARRASNLSGGQQQRVAIARMLMQDPEIVLADEPIASLDPKSGREVMDLLWAIAKERQLTVICALHQLEIAKEYGNRLIGLKFGKLILDGSAKEISDAELQQLYEDVSPDDSHDHSERTQQQKKEVTTR
jgi:phosphonate transport system ATP-binding protein